MTSRAAFTPEQWQALRTAPQLVAITTAAAGSSGLFGSLGEGIATASSIAEAVRGDNPLLRELFATEEIKAAQEQVRSAVQAAASQEQLNQQLQSAVARTVPAALAALVAGGTPSDLEAYRGLLKGIAERVANASKEGDFLGFGGERVSEEERSFLAKLDGLLGSARG